ncbi:MAG TPA: zinc ribbon domain-containing protein [Ignavibacteria bacterium]
MAIIISRISKEKLEDIAHINFKYFFRITRIYMDKDIEYYNNVVMPIYNKYVPAGFDPDEKEVEKTIKNVVDLQETNDNNLKEETDTHSQTNIVFTDQNIIRSIFCSKCGTNINSEQQYCSKCGNKIEASTMELSYEEDKKYCSNCGKMISKEANFCEFCGFKFAIDHVEQPKKYYCQNCSREVSLGDLSCRYCGYSFRRTINKQQVNGTSNGSIWAIVGFFSAIISTFLFPPAFGIFGIFCGARAVKLGSDFGGGIIIVLSIICMIIGIILGAASMLKHFQ